LIRAQFSEGDLTAIGSEEEMWQLGTQEFLVPGQNDLLDRIEFLFSSNRQRDTELSDTQ
jgi:hypothetical protein